MMPVKCTFNIIASQKPKSNLPPDFRHRTSNILELDQWITGKIVENYI
jgi:hypothetical protein